MAKQTTKLLIEKLLAKLINNEKLVATLSIFWFVVMLLAGSVLVARPSVNLVGIGIFNIHLFKFVLMGSYLIFCCIYVLLIKQKESNLRRNTLKFILLLSVLEIGINYSVSLLDNLYYPNFVYSRFHIYPPFLYNFTNLLLILVAFTIMWFAKDTPMLKGGILGSIFMNKLVVVKLLLLFVFGSAILGSVKTIVIEAVNIRKIQKLGVDFSIRTIDLGDFAYDMEFVLKNTPADSVLLHPEQSEDFPLVGNEVLDRYYLYPRILVSPGKVDLFSKDYQGRDCKLYSIVSMGPLPLKNIFPMTKIDVNEFKYLTKSNTVNNMNITKFDPKMIYNITDFKIGIIRHKKCSI